jgi:hypothetical protein
MEGGTMRLTKVVTIVVALALLLFGAFALSAQATTKIDFDMAAPTSGTISYGGGETSISGTNIQVDTVVGVDTPLNSGTVLTLTNGLLGFTTGNYIAGESTGTQAAFGPGTLTLSGTINFPSSPGPGPVTDTWITGTFQRAYVNWAGNTGRIYATGFTDTKGEELVEFYFGENFSLVNWEGFVNLSFDASQFPPTGFTTTSLGSGDVANYVPLPPTALLLGGGLLGLVGLGWRRRRS